MHDCVLHQMELAHAQAEAAAAVAEAERIRACVPSWVKLDPTPRACLSICTCTYTHTRTLIRVSLAAAPVAKERPRSVTGACHSIVCPDVVCRVALLILLLGTCRPACFLIVFHGILYSIPYHSYSIDMATVGFLSGLHRFSWPCVQLRCLRLSAS